MAQCDVCGNNYDKSMQITIDQKTYSFDCFECAIAKLAPTCEHCNVRIIGHGVENAGSFYCCAHCAQESGVSGITDRVR